MKPHVILVNETRWSEKDIKFFGSLTGILRVECQNPSNGGYKQLTIYFAEEKMADDFLRIAGETIKGAEVTFFN